MEFITQPPQKIERFFARFRHRLGDNPSPLKLSKLLNPKSNCRNPDASMKIPQAAGTFLDVRFLQVNRCTVRFVAGTPFLNCFCDEFSDLLLEKVLGGQSLKFTVNLSGTDNVSRFKHRSFGENIVVGRADTLLERSTAMPNLETDVPQCRNQLVGKRFHLTHVQFPRGCRLT